MKSGYRGTFVIPWEQTEIDGVASPQIEDLRNGSCWRWFGTPLRVDGPNGILVLDGAQGRDDLRKRAARAAEKLTGVVHHKAVRGDQSVYEEPWFGNGFVVTDGAQAYTVTLVDLRPDTRPLLMFLDAIPPKDKGLWVVRHVIAGIPQKSVGMTRPGVICFTPGTLIRTPDGEKPIEDLHEGDAIQTKDDGVQSIQWIGQRRMSGARLYAMPSLRPVRIRAGALGEDEPVGDLLVSPQHRMLIHGEAAKLLFNTPEVLVAARDLVNDNSILVDHAMREVTYIHLLLERHQIVWANGVETESFHPAGTSLDTVTADERERLFEILPALRQDTQSYGGYARRNLTASEAEILCFEDGMWH